MATPAGAAPRSTTVVMNVPREEGGALIAPFVRSARDLVAAKYLLYQLTSRDVRIRYKQAVMGLGWALLMPVLVVLAGTAVRVAMANVAGAALDVRDLGEVAAKGLPWSFFVGAIGFATSSLTGNVNLVTKINFPRETLPLAAVCAQLFDSGIAAIVLVVLLPFLGAKLSFALLWIPVLIALLVAFTIGLALLLSCANLFYRDVKYIVQVAMTFGVFFVPVFYNAAVFGEKWSRVLLSNPLGVVLEGLRLSLFEGHNLARPLTEMVHGAPVLVWSPWYLVISTVITLVLLIGSAAIFDRSQHLFAERI